MEGTKPVDCAPTCKNITLCEHFCVGYEIKEEVSDAKKLLITYALLSMMHRGEI